jgi:FKBP-type peptidyl-prolyl cis-trans isomerase FkpA
MGKSFLTAFLALAAFLATGCLGDPVTYEEQLAKDLKKIEQYLSENNLDAESTPSGLHYVMEVEGAGGHPNINSTVTVHYRGELLDGTVFDETGTDPVTFSLLNVIPGWQEGLQLFKIGGKGTLIVPSGLGYGRSSVGGIPANSVLVFDVELVDF